MKALAKTLVGIIFVHGCAAGCPAGLNGGDAGGDAHGFDLSEPFTGMRGECTDGSSPTTCERARCLMVAGDASTGELLIYNDCETSLYLNDTGADRLDVPGGDRYIGGRLVGSDEKVYVSRMFSRGDSPVIELPSNEVSVTTLLTKHAVFDCHPPKRPVEHGRILLTFVIPALLLEGEEVPELPHCSASSCACSAGSCNPPGTLCQHLPDNIVFEDFVEVELDAWTTW